MLLPCEGDIIETNAEHTPLKRKFNRNRLDLLPNIRWRGPDGQDIGIVGDTFRYVAQFIIIYKPSRVSLWLK